MSFEKRLKTEFTDVSSKLADLRKFINSKKFDNVNEVQKNLLVVQADAMETYATCLYQRLRNLGEM